MMIPLLIQNCYWVAPGKFLAGEYPRDLDETASIKKLDGLIQAGVKAFIDLTEQYNGLRPYDALLKRYGDQTVSHQRFAIQDVSIPHSDEWTAAILDAIDLHLAQERMVYLHCYGGIGRTGVIVGCWLARHGYPGQAALNQLRQLWKQNPKSARVRSPETREQEIYIINWEEAY